MDWSYTSMYFTLKLVVLVWMCIPHRTVAAAFASSTRARVASHTPNHATYAGTGGTDWFVHSILISSHLLACLQPCLERQLGSNSDGSPSGSQVRPEALWCSSVCVLPVLQNNVWCTCAKVCVILRLCEIDFFACLFHSHSLNKSRFPIQMELAETVVRTGHVRQ